MARKNLANRGRTFEEMIELTNAQYRAQGVAVIEKMETKWQVIRQGKQIVNAFPVKKSTVDFMGIMAGGPAVAFEAKSTENKTSFPLKNIEQHQMDFLGDFQQLGGAAFFLIEFAYYEVETVFLCTYDQIKKWMDLYHKGGRASITLEWFKTEAWTVGDWDRSDGRRFYMDYLKTWEVAILEQQT